MRTFVFHLPLDLALPAVAAVFVLVLILQRWLHRSAERRRSETELRRSSNLHQLTSTISESNDPKQMVEGVLDRTLETLGTPAGCMVLRTPGSEELDYSSARGFSAAAMVRLSGGPLHAYLCSSVDRWGSLMVFPDLYRTDLMDAWQRDLSFRDFRDFFVAEGLRTLVVICLQIKERPYGVLVVGSRSLRTFQPGELRLMLAIGNQISVAIENARLFQIEQRRARHLALLNELGRKAMAVLNLQELLSNICQQVRNAFGYDLVRLETFDGERDELVVAAQEGYGAEVLGRRFKLGEGLSGVAAARGEPVLANSVAQEGRYIALQAGVGSSLSLPLKYRDEMLGVLSVESPREHSFSQQDVLTLRTLGDQLAIALHNARAYQVAQEEAITDGLTRLKTHRYFMEALEAEWRRATRGERPFSLIIMDLDGFKQVNDRRGHLEGDKVLTAVASVLDARCRQSNVVARYGGDEFVILLPETGTDPAEILAERLRASLATDQYLSSHGVTASFGIATFPVHGATPEEILRVADSGMYLAKHEQGNRVRVASRTTQAASPDWEHQLLEAYLGVAVKRMFSTGPEEFNQYLQRFEQATQSPGGESLSLMDTVTALAFAIDAKDHYTQGHSQAVSRLAVQVAIQLGLPATEVEEIRLAGILHDIGKIGVPEAVLNKPTRLTPEEYEIMKSHAALGGKILEPLKVKAIERIRRMVRHHHEYVDGRGYPDGLRGEEIPLGARILTVADSFDTMVSDRAYKKGRSTDEALGELRRCSGSQFDTALVDALVKSFAAVGDPRKSTAYEQAAN